MGILDVFKKEQQCQRCSRIVDKKLVCSFDCPPEEGASGLRVRICLCPECSQEQWRTSMARFKGKVVAVHPMSGYGGYHFYAFSEMPGLEYTNAFIRALKGLLPPAEARCRCGQSATVRWCSPELFNNNPTEESEDIFPCEQVLMCGGCFVNAVRETIASGENRVAEVLLPGREDGFFTPMEA